jgi:lysylphosphatidylglycerol synthetase-like protein (DUF2156 family)
MGATERHTLPIPYGHHVFVVSDLSLSARTSTRSRPLVELTTLLGDIDDPAVVVIAGNLFFPDPERDFADEIATTLAHLGDFVAAVRAFVAHQTHQFYVLPGSDDAALASDERAQALLEDLGVVVASDLMLQVASSEGVHDLAIAAGSHRVDVHNVDSADRADADRLEDPAALASFVASRVLYRRLAPWIWLVLLALLGADLFNSVTKLIGHFTHHVYEVHAPHTNSFWGNLIVNLFVLILAEALVVGAAGLVVRRRFNRSHHGDAESEPLANTLVDQENALDFARRIVERGGVGAVIGGAPRPALAFLDRGVCAVPGPSRTVLIKREGRLGLPPVFTSVQRLGIVEIEAASNVQVRLIGGESPLSRSRLIERLVGGTPTQVGPPPGTTTLGSWPHGSPFPLTESWLQSQHHQRSTRRWASGLLFVDGLINVAVTASPPLRTRLHTVLNVLPLGVAQSAAVVTAVAGIAMIMLARGVRRGQRRAWFLALAALTITIFAHLARGGSLLASVMAAALATFLVLQRRNFLAASDRNSASTILPRLAGVAVIAVIAAALGVEAAARHRFVLPNFGVVVMACVERLVGQYNIFLPDATTDFVDPVLLTVGISIVIATLYILTRPVVDRRLSTTGTSAERRVAELRARDIVRRHGRGTLDYFALRDDKQFFFFRDSLVAYAVYGGVALISPDPIGPDAERAEVFNAFRVYSEARGWTIAVMGAGSDWLGTYHAAGMHYLYLGDEAIVDVQKFSLEGGKMKGLRQACTRLNKHGYTVEFLDPADIDPVHVTGILELISMLRRGEGERGFSMMLGRLFDPKDKGLLLTLVNGPDGQPAAACQFVPSPAIKGYSLDLMRRDPGEHPNGLIDYALCSTIEHLKQRGDQGLSLNFAAFRSVLDGERGEGTFTRVERWTLKRLSGILPIESLWLFNAKYHPRWLPRYIVYPAAESFVPVLAAILRAESITEIPVLGRFLTNDPRNRPGTVVPPDILAAAQAVDEQVEEDV